MSMIGELRQVPAELIVDGSLDEEEVERLMDSTELAVSLDKAWHALHFMLGDDETAVMGGLPVDGPDCGYGPPQLVEPEDVKAYAVQLEGLDEDWLRRSYDPAAMTRAHVYPEIWDREEEREQNLEWLLERYRALRDFYRDAAARGNGVLFFLT